MSSQFLVLSSQSDFDSLNATLNSAFGYPTADGQTLTYAQPIVNGSQVAIIIEDVCLPYLSSQQISALVDYTTMQSNGWFQPLR